MRKLSEIADDIIELRADRKYAFMSPEAIATMVVAQQLERIADRAQVSVSPIATISRPVSQAAVLDAVDRLPATPIVGMEQAVANQRSAEAPVIPRFTAPQGQGKRK